MNAPSFPQIEHAFRDGKVRGPFVLKSASEIIWEGVRAEVAALEAAMAGRPIARLSGPELDRHMAAELAHSMKTQRDRLARNHARRLRIAARVAVQS